MIIEHKKQAPVKHQCGTPRSECAGSVDSRFGTSSKLHSSVEEAETCFRKYLIRQGYVPAGPNTWSHPDEVTLKVTA